MNDDVESRLRRSLGQRASDSIGGDPDLPPATRRRAQTRRITNALTAGVAAVAIIAGGTTIATRRLISKPSLTLPVGSPTRVPEPALGSPSVQPAPRSTPARSATSRVAEVSDAGVKIVAHDGVWVIATTRVFKYSFAGALLERIVIPDLLGPNAVLEPRVVADDDAGVWVAGTGANDVERTKESGSCASIEPFGGDRPGEAFVLRVDRGTGCPSVFIKLGEFGSQPPPSPGLLPTKPTASPQPGRPRYVRWHGLAAAAGSLWIGADGGMLRADLAGGTLEELGLDAYSVGAGFGSVWAAVSQNRGTPDEDDYIARIDPATSKVEAKIDVPPADPATTTDYAEVHVGPDAVWAEGWGIVAQVSPQTNQVVARYDVGGEHLQGDMTSGGGFFYLPDNGKKADGFWVIDAAGRRLVRKVTTGGAVSGIVLAGDRLWFSRNAAIYRMKVR